MHSLRLSGLFMACCSLVWVHLAAPDVALTEAALGRRITGAAARCEYTFAHAETPAAASGGATLRLATAFSAPWRIGGVATILLL
jgi:hypothetical protein